MKRLGCVKKALSPVRLLLSFRQKQLNPGCRIGTKRENSDVRNDWDWPAPFGDGSVRISAKFTYQAKASLRVLCCLGICFSTTSAADSALLRELRQSAAAGDLRPVSAMITDMRRESFRPADELSRILMQQFRERFETDPGIWNSYSENPLVDGAIDVYRDYWRAVLTHALPAEQADRVLQVQLRELVAAHAEIPVSNQDIFQQLEITLAQQGFGSSAGFTAPWRDLYIWRGQRAEWFEVQLTDMVKNVQVTFIDQPLIQGWQHFASLDLVSTSGWATASGLYCLCVSYDLESTAFRVSWLKHETRHQADLERYPGMDMTQLEYRAKLTELAFSGSEDRTLLRQFTASASDAGGSAHSVANARVSRDIYREIFDRELPTEVDPWRELGPYKVAPAARKLLERDTEALRAAVTGN